MLRSQSAPKARRGRGWGLGRDSSVEFHKGKSVGIERTKGGILGKQGAAKELEMEKPEGQEDSREIEGRSQEGEPESNIIALVRRTKPSYLESGNDFVENSFR